MIHHTEHEPHVSLKAQTGFYYLGLGKILNLHSNTNVFMPSDAGLFFWETIHSSFVGKISPSMRALDLGCGSGFVAMGLSLFGCGHVTASDVNPTHVDYAREQFTRNVPPGSGSRFVVSDLYDALGEETFDLIAFNCPGWATPTDTFSAKIKEISEMQYYSMFEGDRIAIRSINEGLNRIRSGGSLVLGLNSIGNISEVISRSRLADNKRFTLRLIGKKDFPLLLYNEKWCKNRDLLDAQLEEWRRAGVSYFRRVGEQIIWTCEIVCITDLGGRALS